MSEGREIEISVVVPVRNGARSLDALLDSLDHQTLERERFEVVVVDNASQDDTAKVARGRGATVIEEPVPNRALARNAGARVAGAPRLAFIDADCRAEPRWLEALLQCLEHAEMASGPVMVITDDPPRIVERFETLWRFPQETAVRQRWSATANLAVRRLVFETVGGFDHTYRHIGEDVDFCLKAADAGFQITWCPDARVRHPAETSLWPVLARAARHGYSDSQLRWRYGSHAGGHHWRAPKPLIRGGGVLAGLPEVAIAGPGRRRMALIARLEYAARMAGSAWAALRRDH